jgi:hypothetical protein
MTNAKLFVKKKENKVLKSSSSRFSSSYSSFRHGLLGLSELGIPKRRKSSSKRAVRHVAATTTGQGMSRELTDCTAWISLQRKKDNQRN